MQKEAESGSFPVIDKNGMLQRIEAMPGVVLELGCGSAKQVPGAIGIDRIDYPSVDIICDLSKGLPFVPDNSVDAIHSFHLLEHLPDLGFFLSEIHRVLKPGGKMLGTVPHFSNPYYYSDYTHKTPFGMYTFCYFAESTPYRRKALRYREDFGFRIVRQKLVFYSPFKVINVFMKLSGWTFNSCRLTQEIYEGLFSKIVPAHEISFELCKE